MKTLLAQLQNDVWDSKIVTRRIKNTLVRTLHPNEQCDQGRGGEGRGEELLTLHPNEQNR